MAVREDDQAKAAIRYCLRSLTPDDQFAIVPFSTEPRPFRDRRVVLASAETAPPREKFVDGLEAAGGTAIDERAARPDSTWARHEQDEPASGDRAFLTDGLPTIGETDVAKILEHTSGRSQSARLFVFASATSVNTKLLDRLAADNRGTRDYVAESESIEEKVSVALRQAREAGDDRRSR